jgi:hypothetical protein
MRPIILSLWPALFTRTWQQFLKTTGKSRRKLAIIHAEGSEIWKELRQSCGNVQVSAASG